MTDSRWLYAWGVASIALGGASLLVPLYVVSLGGGPVDLGLLAASAAFVGVPGALGSGRLAATQRARRPIVVGALLSLAVVLGVTPMARSIEVVLVANAVIWFASAAISPVVTLMVTVGAPEADWGNRFASLNAAQGWGWAGGLVLGVAWTAVVGHLLGPAMAQRTLFWVIAVCAGVGALLMARWLPTKGGRRALNAPRTVARALARARRTNVRGATVPFTPGRLFWSTRGLHPRRFAARFSRTLGVYFLAVVCFFTGFSVFFAPLPVFLTEAGYSSDEVFVLYLISSLGAAAFFVTAGRLASTYDVSAVQVGGLSLRAVGLPAVAVVGTVFTGPLSGRLVLGALFLIIGLAWAIVAVTASTLVTRLAPVDVRGEALGTFTALTAFAGGVGSLLGGVLARTGFELAFGVAGGLVFVGALVVLVVRTLATETTASEPAVT
ncbi:MFS transporter [Haloarculaceae archaeon H-GB11]|nr:MFS transporter [Haloarculaceae archaeon H-GB11]